MKNQSLRDFALRTVALTLLFGTATASPNSSRGEEAKDKPLPARPNILWLSCEDISPHLGCYGDPHAITPNLDNLAAQGVRYTHAFTAAGVCAPCRSTIITGMYQNSIGTHHMRCNAVLPEWMRPFPQYLMDAGYYCTNNSKTDYQFKKPSAKQIWDESGKKAHWKNRKKDQPFFAVFNFTGCHESGIAGKSKYEDVTSQLSPSQRQQPEDLSTLPPYYPDTDVTREDWKRNYELITAMDQWAGDHLRELEEAGLAENTIVFFWSDHGVGLPRAKRWLYDSGTRIPFIVRTPEAFRTAGQGQANTVSSELISSVDFGPTVLNLCGIDVPDYVQGRAFLGDHLSPERKFIYGARDRMDERYDIIRAVRDQRFRYIRNYEPLKPYYQFMNTPEKGATMQAIRQAETADSLNAAGKLFSASSKPIEELYDLESDPHEIHNLAGLPEFKRQLESMRSECLRWQSEVRDIGLVPEAEIEVRESQLGTRFEILRSGLKDQSAQHVVDQLVAVAAAASEGPTAIPALLKSCQHTDATIRYWGATGLGNIGTPAREASSQTMRDLLDDVSPSVRIAAARALCRQGHLDEGLKQLSSELESEHQWGRLAAAIALDELDEEARPVLDALQAALVDQPNKYIVRVANKAVNDLLGTSNKVP
ncbi:MAG: sulfatase-like hydrolase/transferase [Planctomycetota bacterium]